MGSTHTVLTTAEAAARLGLSRQRVHQLWRDGQLVGRLAGNQLLLDSVSVQDLAHRARPAARPLSARNAWSLLLLLSDTTASWTTSSERSRLRSLILTRRADELASLARSRAARQCFNGPAGVAPRLARCPGVATSGVSVRGRWSDRVADGAVEVYTSADAAGQLVQELELSPAPRGPIVLHVVDDTLAPRVLSSGQTLQPVVALDLLENADAELASIGRRMWSSWVTQWTTLDPTLIVDERRE